MKSADCLVAVNGIVLISVATRLYTIYIFMLQEILHHVLKNPCHCKQMNQFLCLLFSSNLNKLA